MLVGQISAVYMQMTEKHPEAKSFPMSANDVLKLMVNISTDYTDADADADVVE